VGFKDLFTAEGRKARALERNIAKAANKKIKPDERQPALYELITDGSDAAVLGLLKRFTFIYDINMVRDEEEKNYAYEGLLSMGDRIVPLVQIHLTAAPTLSWGLRLVTDLCDHDGAWDVLEKVLEGYTAEYERDPSRKIQLMTFLGEFEDPRAVKALLPFLQDHDETVRFVTVEALFKQKDERAREPMLELLTNEDEESLRIRRRIVEWLHDAGWTAKGFRGKVEKLLALDFPEFAVNAKGRIKLKRARNT